MECSSGQIEDVIYKLQHHRRRRNKLTLLMKQKMPQLLKDQNVKNKNSLNQYLEKRLLEYYLKVQKIN